MDDDLNKRSGMRGPNRIEHVLINLAHRLGLHGIVRRWRIFSAWPEVVGEKLAQKTEPVNLADDVLVVKVSDPTWAHELTYLKEGILDKLSERVKDRPPKDIRFFTGSTRGSYVPKNERIDIARFDIDPAEIAESLDEQALKDKPELRELFEALIETSFRIRKHLHDD